MVPCPLTSEHKRVLVLQENPGFVQSHEFLEKSWNLSSNFPELKKVWKVVKSLELFFKATASAGKIFFNLPHTFVVHRKRALFLHFLRSVLITHLITASLEKCLEFWIQKSVGTLIVYSVYTVVVTCPRWPDRTLFEPRL